MSEERYSQYDPWAWLYNKTLGPSYANKQFSMLQTRVLPLLPQNARVLDLCCGTGHLMLPLQQAGLSTVGLDGSEEMLQHARNNVPNTPMMLADARHFKINEGEKFDAVVCASASLNHIPNLDDIAQVFAAVYDAMHGNGIFVFDINHPIQMEAYWKSRPSEGEIKSDYAWLITPSYDDREKLGKFTIDIYRSQGSRRLTSSLKGLLSRWKRLYRWRLDLLSKFSELQPHWSHDHLSYDVVGHDLEVLRNLLLDSGFNEVHIENNQGSKTLNNHQSAYFICHKSASHNHSEHQDRPITQVSSLPGAA